MNSEPEKNKVDVESFLSVHQKKIVFIAILLLAAVISIPIYFFLRNNDARISIRQLELVEDMYSDFIKNYAIYKDHEDIPEDEINSIITAYTEIIDAYPKEIAAQKAASYLAYVYFVQKKYTESITFYERAIELSKAGTYLSPLIYFNLASAYENADDSQKALNTYRNLVENFPHSLEAAHAMFNIARLQEANNSFEQAIEDYHFLAENENWLDSPWRDIAKSRLATLDQLNTPEKTQTQNVLDAE